jgi:hypothetical protein
LGLLNKKKQGGGSLMINIDKQIAFWRGSAEEDMAVAREPSR